MTREKQELIVCVNGVTDCRAVRYVGETPFCTALKEAFFPCKFYKNDAQHDYDLYKIRIGDAKPITTCGGYYD